MPFFWRRGVGLLVCLAIVVTLWGIPSARLYKAAAQSEPQEPVYPLAQLYPLDLQEFPIIHTSLDIYDSDGNFLHNVTQEQVTIIENEQSLTPLSLIETAPGVQFVLAVTHGPAMGIRDGLGNSRYDYLLERLHAWEAYPAADSPDDFSLVVENGPETTHVNQLAQILAGLQGYQVDSRQVIPSLQALNRAIEIALDPTDRPGMKRAILFITPPQPVEGTAGLQSLASQAAQAGIRIFVWQVSAPDEIETPPSRLLERMAALTGGKFFNFTGEEDLPPVESILDPLKFMYELSYRSAITNSGSYAIAAQVQQGDLTIVSLQQNLEMVLLPPNPVFIALPSRIELQKPGQETAPDDESGLNPTPTELVQQKTQALKVLVEFPDGYPRRLIESTLLVDGIVIDRKSEAPFDVFSWDLTAYESSGQHLVQVAVKDVLGLSGSSLPMPVEVVVDVQAYRFVGGSPIRLVGLAAVSLLFLGALIGLGLVLGGKLQPYRFGRAMIGRARTVFPFSRSRRAGIPASAASRLEGQENRIGNNANLPGTAEGNQTGWLQRIAHPRPRARQPAIAFLTPVAESKASADEVPVPITSQGVILGSDPAQVTWTLHDSAIAPVHARLTTDGEQTVIFDEGTVAGTWVNYQLVPEEGCRLYHGDLVHVGSMSFRFKSSHPKDIRKLIILTQERST